MTEAMPDDDGGGGNFFTQKYGPLPGWAWIIVTFALVYIYMKYKSSKSSTSTTTTTTGTGTSTGTSNALTSNLVGVEEPVPVLNGTYQISVTPENSPSSVNTSVGSTSTQGFGQGQPAAGSLNGTETSSNNAAPTISVQPQTQSSSPQTQSTPTS